MAAASGFYNDSVMYMPWSMSREVKRFYTLFKHVFPLKKNRDIDFSKVTKVVIVDSSVKALSPALRELADKKKIDLIRYDHHYGQEQPGEQGVKSVNIPCGACVTYFAGRLIEDNAEITKEEALLFLLGIYSDTGNFTYPNTTPEDMKTASRLLDKGVNRRLLSDFLSKNFDSPQVKLFNRLVKNMQSFEIKGYRVIITYARFKEYIRRLADVTTQVMSINSADAIVSVVQMENKIFISARSADDRIDIRKVMKEFRGGGHRTAAAAVAPVKKSVSIKTIKDSVYDGLMKVIKERYTVKDIMSTPVRAIPPSLTIEEAYKVAIRFNNNGLPVVKNDKLAGFITKEDIEKGILHKLGSIPVSGYMSTNVITVSEDTTVAEAQRKMLKNNIGHLPVIDGDRLKGIVTRTDVLEFLYNERPLKKEKIVFEEKDINVRAVMEEKLDRGIFSYIRKIGEYADEYGVNVYLVGGMVRDLFLEEKDLDVDITVEGDGMAFARFLADKFKGGYKGFERFKTAKVFLKEEKRIDVTSARAEFYEYPAALPDIEFTPIRYDLYRRDFTINAMAIKINSNGFGNFTDYFNGYEDLKNGVIRTLYNMSFIDDPTRIIRAVRFEQRYNFKIEENTFRFIKETLKYNIFESLSGERLRDEILLLFEEENPCRAMKRMESLGVLSKINEKFKISAAAERLCKKAMASFDFFEAAGCVDRALVFFMIFTGSMPGEEVSSLMSRLKLSNTRKKKVLSVNGIEGKLVSRLEKPGIKDSAIVKVLEGYSPEALVYFMIAAGRREAEKNIRKYMEKLNTVKPQITGKDLKALGIKEGPYYREILAEIKGAKLDDRVKTKEEELSLARSLAGSKKKKTKKAEKKTTGNKED